MGDLPRRLIYSAIAAFANFGEVDLAYGVAIGIKDDFLLKALVRATARYGSFHRFPWFSVFQGCEHNGGGIVGRNGAVSRFALETFEVSVGEFFGSR